VPKSYQAMGLGKALEAVGLAERSKNGELTTNASYLYALEQYMPLFGRARRLAPSEDRYNERWGTTAVSFAFGVGLRTNTPTEQRGEIRRRIRVADDMATDLRSKGYGGYYEFDLMKEVPYEGYEKPEDPQTGRTRLTTALKGRTGRGNAFDGSSRRIGGVVGGGDEREREMDARIKALVGRTG
jgi:hypothetical protein